MNVIAFFCDAQILPGFHAALTSLIVNHQSTISISIILFEDQLTKNQKTKILDTFNKNKKSNQFFEIRAAPNMKIPSANALAGNFTTYGRLFLGELLPKENIVLYLDSDIIVNCDINDVFIEMVGDYTLYVSGVGERNWSLDKKLYEKAGLKMGELCFNAGIIGINLKKWREKDGFKKCLDMIKLYPNQFLSADQALLNVTFHDDFLILPENINISALPSRFVNTNNGIYHFIGFPKPWDLLGKKMHDNYKLWEKYFLKSSIGNRNYLKYSTLKRLTKSFFFFLKYISKNVK